MHCSDEDQVPYILRNQVYKRLFEMGFGVGGVGGPGTCLSIPYLLIVCQGEKKGIEGGVRKDPYPWAILSGGINSM